MKNRKVWNGRTGKWMADKETKINSFTGKPKKTHAKDCAFETFSKGDGSARCDCEVFNKPHHTPTPWELGTGNTREIWGYQDDENQNDVLIASCKSNGLIKTDEERGNAAFIVRAVNAHEELLTAAKNVRNVLAGLVTGDLKSIKADSPALLALRNAIAKAEGK